jgi:hypothetical protein
MIDYLGISTREIFCEGLPRVQFEVCFLNTTKNGLFTIRTTASPRSLENPKVLCKKLQIFAPPSAKPGKRPSASFADGFTLLLATAK